jgi:hypothetical protein
MKTLLIAALLSASIFAETCYQKYLIVNHEHILYETGRTFEIENDSNGTIILDGEVFKRSHFYANNGSEIYIRR